jgi:hypothetical protein
MSHPFLPILSGILFLCSCGVLLFIKVSDRTEARFIKLGASSMLLASLLKFIVEVASVPQPLSRILSSQGTSLIAFTFGVVICLNIYKKDRKNS